METPLLEIQELAVNLWHCLTLVVGRNLKFPALTWLPPVSWQRNKPIVPPGLLCPKVSRQSSPCLTSPKARASSSFGTLHTKKKKNPKITDMKPFLYTNVCVYWPSVIQDLFQHYKQQCWAVQRFFKFAIKLEYIRIYILCIANNYHSLERRKKKSKSNVTNKITYFSSG